MIAAAPSPPTAGEHGREPSRRLRERLRRNPPRPPGQPAALLPVARVAVDVPHAHLDRPFDYLVTEPQSEAAVPGARVRVRFAGQEVDGYVLERVEASAHAGALHELRRVVSGEAVLSPQVARLARAVADRYAGTMSDVLRLAVPPRHARVEREVRPDVAGVPPVPLDPGAWAPYVAGSAYLAALARGEAPRAVWSALPGPGWPDALAAAAAATAASGRGALLVLPDLRDVERVAAAVRRTVDPATVVALTADAGPPERYRRWLAVRRGTARVVVGTRAAMFAPVQRLGLAVVWDDGDDLHAEPRAPYPHVREVLGLRAVEESAALLVGGHARTAEGALLVESGFARSIAAARPTVRAVMPIVRTAGEEAQAADPAAAGARLPTAAWRAAREALATGPVLVQVPRRGYLPAVACSTCRTPARCTACAGPMALTAAGVEPTCRWCGRGAGPWRCPRCEATGLRALAVGARRTAEELGRAFPGVPVRTSGRDGVLGSVDGQPALVVSTPGAEPVAVGGYAAALLLDGWALLGHPRLRVAEEALRRWMAAAALVRPHGDGGVVMLMADAAQPPVQALLRWDPVTAADRELAGRRELHFPPAVRLASVTGPGEALEELRGRLPPGAQALGPVPAGDQERLLVRVPLAGAAELSRSLRTWQAARSLRKAEPVRVQVDPQDLG